MYKVIYDDGLDVMSEMVDAEDLGEFISQIEANGFHVIDIEIE